MHLREKKTLHRRHQAQTRVKICQKGFHKISGFDENKGQLASFYLS